MKRIEVVGKSREEIEEITASYRRADLLDLVYQLATIEPKFSPATIAAANQMTKAHVMKLIKDGTIPVAHKTMENGWRVPLSALREWDENTAVRVADLQPASD